MVFFSSIKRFEVTIQRFFVNLFYSIPDSNLQFIKGKLAGIFVDILRATLYNKRQKKILTGPVWFISVMHISNTLTGTSASRWYCGRFAVFRGTLLGLRKPTDTKPLFHSLVMNQLESTDGLDSLAQISFIKRKKHKIQKIRNLYMKKYKEPGLGLPNGKTENGKSYLIFLHVLRITYCYFRESRSS